MPFVTHPYTIYHLRKKQVNPNCSATKSRYEWERCTDKKERKIVLRETFQIAKEKATEENVYDYLKCYRIRDVRDYLGYRIPSESSLLLLPAMVQANQKCETINKGPKVLHKTEVQPNIF
ncbi:hypothetical protein Avbf_06962 [Armadillidium vulgare]|nr:hypothetical protein Avbf_06962 [Armadillidium vulgare]